jgi:hypothetical protein
MRRKRPPGPVMANDDGTFSINLSADERETLTGFINQLRDLLRHGPDDERLRRLYPVAYHADGGLDDEYQSYMRDELTNSRAAAMDTAIDMLSRETPISEAELSALMRVVNSLRLVLGTLLDVGEGQDESDVDESDPSHGQHQLYGYLGWFLEWIVWALSGD